MNIRYGYDIRGEVVGEDGTAALGDSSPVTVRKNNQFSGRVPEDWRERFIAAYDVEFQEWIDGVRDGGTYGPSSWDGYAAAAVSDAAVESITTGPHHREAGREARAVRLARAHRRPTRGRLWGRGYSWPSPPPRSRRAQSAPPRQTSPTENSLVTQ